MIHAAAYIRMSSDKQEASRQQQRNEIELLAAREGVRIVRWFVDEGYLGTHGQECCARFIVHCR